MPYGHAYKPREGWKFGWRVQPRGLCKFCHGHGNCMAIQNGKMEWRVCPFCEGHGTRNEFRGTPTISTNAR